MPGVLGSEAMQHKVFSLLLQLRAEQRLWIWTSDLLSSGWDWGRLKGILGLLRASTSRCDYLSRTRLHCHCGPNGLDNYLQWSQQLSCFSASSSLSALSRLCMGYIGMPAAPSPPHHHCNHNHRQSPTPLSSLLFAAASVGSCKARGRVWPASRNSPCLCLQSFAIRSYPGEKQ